VRRLAFDAGDAAPERDLDLRSVVLFTMLSFSLALATLLALLPSVLLLLNRELSISTAQYLFVLTLGGRRGAAARGFMDMRRLDFLLRALAEDSDIVDAKDVSALGRQSGPRCMQWMVPHLISSRCSPPHAPRADGPRPASR
jgi:hypothetical protein